MRSSDWSSDVCSSDLLASGKVAITERHTGEKQQGSVDWFVASIDSIMRNIQDSLLNEALRRLGDRTTDAGTPLEAREAAQAGFGRIPWSALAHGGEAVLRDAAVPVRCITPPTAAVPDGPPGAANFTVVSRYSSSRLHGAPDAYPLHPPP